MRATLVRYHERSDFPSPDPRHRARWRERRQTLERSPFIHSTPDGLVSDSGGRVREMVMMGARIVMRAFGFHGPASRAAARVELVRHAVRLPNLPNELEGYRILHISDPHFDGLPGLAEAIVQAVGGEPVDLGLFGGDYRFAGRGPFRETAVLRDLERVAKGIRPRDGWLGVLGNHDTHDMTGQIERLGVRLLVNESVRIRLGRARLLVAGVDDVHRFFTEAAVTALDPPESTLDEVGIALVHSPELAPEAAAAGYHLYLCGHTHGGQVRPVLGRPLTTHLHRCKRLAAGAWRLDGMQGYTSRGAGISGVPLRWNCPGEITLFTLTRGL